MKRGRWLLLMLIACVAAAGCNRSRSATPFNCIGHWRVADKSGQPYFITLHEDHRASSTLPHHGEGTWSVERFNIRIVWQNYWVDYLVVADSGVSRVGCAPGENLDTIPESSSKAERVDDVPVQ